MDREKVVSHLQIINTWATVDLRSPKEPIWSYRTLEDVKQWTDDAIALLKEQGDLGTELTNAMELVHKKNERIKKLEEQIETLTKWRANAGAFD